MARVPYVDREQLDTEGQEITNHHPLRASIAARQKCDRRCFRRRAKIVGNPRRSRSDAHVQLLQRDQYCTDRAQAGVGSREGLDLVM